MRSRAALVTALIAASAFAGCGSSSDPAGSATAKQQQQSLNVVSAQDVAREPAGSPYHALLQWWRVTQYRDPVGSMAFFTKDAQRKVKVGFQTLVYRDFGPWLQHVKPRLIRVENIAGQSTLFLVTSTKQILSPTVIRSSDDLEAIPMQKEGGSWKIADPTFFAENAARLHTQRIQSEQAAAKPR